MMQLQYSPRNPCLKLLMVFNPHAAGGRAARLLPNVRDALARFADVDVLQTLGPGHALVQVTETDLSRYDGLVAAGGDGTLFEVLNGLYAHPKERRVPLGLVPVGTGNAFARDLGLLPGNWEKGVALIGRREPRPMDVGRVEMDGGGDSFYFLNIIGAGLPVDAMRTAEKLKFVGSSAYSLAAFWRAMILKTYPLVLEIDGKRLEQKALFVEISNTRYTGTSFLMAPSALVDDGLLDVTVVRRLPRWRLLRLFPTIYRGRHVAYEEVFTCQARSIRICAPDHLVLAPDGELRGQTPATVTCLHRDLEMFT
jgi:diacylglycerol kinase (ATP)